MFDADTPSDLPGLLQCRKCFGVMAADAMTFSQVICAGHRPGSGSCERCGQGRLLYRPVQQCPEQLFMLLSVLQLYGVFQILLHHIYQWT